MYISKSHKLPEPNNDYFSSLKIVLNPTNLVDTDKMLHVAAFHLGLHCSPKALSTSF